MWKVALKDSRKWDYEGLVWECFSVLWVLTSALLDSTLARTMFSGLDNWHKPGIAQPAAKAEGLVIITQSQILICVGSSIPSDINGDGDNY